MRYVAHLRCYLPADDTGQIRPHVPVSPTLRLGEVGVSFESHRNDAYVLTVDGARFVCPRNPRVRMLEAVLAFRNAHPGMTASLLVPEETAEDAARELEQLRQRRREGRSFILSSPFVVPLRWFAAFTAGEREIVEGPSGVSVVYRTDVAAAIERVARAVEVVDGAGFGDQVVDQVRSLHRWLEGIPPTGILELDYDSVCGLFSDADLVLDESAADVNDSLDALEREDYDAAGEAYSRVATRWAYAQALSFAN